MKMVNTTFKIKIFFIYQLMHKNFALKEILKFTLKLFRHVSV